MVADRAAAARRGRADPSARRRALGELLLERYGIVTREQVLAEGIPGGFSAIYAELSQLETLGVARRGYFLEGLGGAQFALPGAVERLRARGAVGGSGGGPASAAAGARRRRPGPALRRGAAVAQATSDDDQAPRPARPGARRASPAPTWCSSAAIRSSTWSAAAARCRRWWPPVTPRVDAALSALVDARAQRGHQAPGPGEGRRRAGDDARRWARRCSRSASRRARAASPSAPESRCLRATRSPTRRTGCGRFWRARCPTRSGLRIPATRMDRWPERLGGRAVTRDPHPRQAPVPPLRGRAGHPLAPAHDRHLGRLCAGPAVAPLAAPGLAGARARRAPGGAVQRAGARADDREPDPLRSAAGRAGPRHPGRRVRRARASWRGCVPTTRRAGSATRCWTSATWPGSATSGRPRAAGRPRWTRGARCRAVTDAEAMAVIAGVRPRMQHSARHGRMSGEPRVFRRAGRPCPRCGAKVLARGQGDDNRTTFWCPGCQR